MTRTSRAKPERSGGRRGRLEPGVLLVDKPAGPTSHDVVDAVRRITGERRCGHTGTLDPFATGLLVLCLGRATRLAPFLSAARKSYRAVVRFGFATDTYDATGRPEGPRREVRLSEAALAEALAALEGPQMQIPPPFAAKKIRGERLYRLARAGVAVAPPPVRVVVHEIRLVGVEADRAVIDVDVSSGTYVRSLAHDLGRRLGVGAHLEELRRTAVAEFRVDDAAGLDRLEAAAAAGTLSELVVPPAAALGHLPARVVDEAAARAFLHGRAVAAPAPGGEPGRPVRVVDGAGAFLGVAVETEAGELRPRLVWARPEETTARGEP